MNTPLAWTHPAGHAAQVHPAGPATQVSIYPAAAVLHGPEIARADSPEQAAQQLAEIGFTPA